MNLVAPHHQRSHLNREHQKGATLIELMVGLTLGLLVVAVATGALMVSRSISGSVSDVSNLQQQGSYILRVMGQQLRQAGSLYLNPDPTGQAPDEVLSAVAFEVTAQPNNGNDFNAHQIISGDTTSLNTAYRRYQDQVFFAANATSSVIGTDYLMRNCLGSPQNNSTDERIESLFTLANGNLRCSGNGVAALQAQPIAQNVAELQFTYLVQTLTAGTSPTIQYMSGDDMPANADDPIWRTVYGIQVCFVLHSNEPVEMPQGSSYTNCAGDAVDMTTLQGIRSNRMHMRFRNTFQLRSQGLPNT